MFTINLRVEMPRWTDDIPVFMADLRMRMQAILDVVMYPGVVHRFEEPPAFWPPLAESTIKRKMKLAKKGEIPMENVYRPLRRYDKLYRSFERGIEPSPTGLGFTAYVETRVPYAPIHQWGSATVPQRMFAYWDEEMIQEALTILLGR